GDMFVRSGVSWLAGLTAAALVAAISACAPAPQAGSTPAPGSQMPRTIVDPYLKIQAALADDSTDGIKANAGEIATAAAALGAPAIKIDTAAVQLAATTE